MNKMIVGIDEVWKVIKKLQDSIKNQNIIVLLQGDLGSGKTTFVKEYVKYIGIKEEVTSPTFSLQSVYGDKIFHYDVYNKTLNEFLALGLFEEFEKKGIHFVEWGDENLEKLLKKYGFQVATIQIIPKNQKREYFINA